ncbi:related to zinc finger protein white collar 2 (wc-2) [Melanopsichium pennsylvanicum]|uniref:Related to zinc finger protein white collar 2 (Wc-2) n=2 Tax=Melanopsichium pennsylvanicum TaxID=63383 RepID=A0AAJ4XLA4_9BASI|nr:related to zinc finger protein white collar 2 (wc-2) [Melanopsichium pennsylvanicum 4]SNX84382.1 related to zinc finger protein white collar 2 (wc-2) [Melanopsichium pennsylvanicum]
MQSQNWSGPSAEQQQGFNASFFNNDGQMSQEALQNMFQGNAPNDISNPNFNGFNPASNFSHPSQMMMPQHAGNGMQNRPVEGDQRFVPNMVSNGLDHAASAAAAAAYGHLGFSNSASAPASRRESQKNPLQVSQATDGTWTAMPNMQDYVQSEAIVNGPMGMRAPNSSDYRANMNGYEPDGPSSNSSEESAHGKRRRMTFGGAPIDPNQMLDANKPMLIHNHSTSSSGISDMTSMESTPIPGFAPDAQPGFATRPSFRHRRSCSGSVIAGAPGSDQRSFSSIDLGGSAHDPYGGGLGYPQPPPLYPAGQQHSHSFVGSQALAAMGGHAASHPPGLGSQILRGVDVSASGSSAATDFTKRKGWTGRVIEELLDFVHVLDPEGVILFASPSVQGLTGWKSEELKGRKLTEFVHPQDVASVEREIDRMRTSKGELLTYYRFKTKPKPVRAPSKKGDTTSNDNESSAGDTGEEKERINERRSEVEHADAFTRDGDYIVFEATGHPYFPPEPAAGPGANDATDDAKDKNDSQANGEGGHATPIGADAEAPKGKVKSETMAPSLSTGSKAAHPLSQEQTLQTPTSDSSTSIRTQLQCFFCSARPYPSKNTSMLDSFLELKLENEKLRLLIADMDLTGPDNEHDRNSSAAAYHPDLLKQELENEAIAGGWAHPVNPMFGAAAVGPDGRILPPQAQAGQRPVHGSRQNSIGSHPTSPLMRTNSARDEVLAGLGVSPGDDSDDEASANQSTAGAANADGAANAADDARRKKKPKQDDGDHVCTDCGRVDSPEWRKGPLGPKTLCNACGLRWAKKIKRKGGDPNMAAGAMMVAGSGMPPAVGAGGGVGLNVGVGMGGHMMMPHGHPHSFNRADSAQLQGIQMAPPGSLPSGINMQGMMNSSPNSFGQRGSFDENPHVQNNNGFNGMGGGHM